jgi:hypothetical protein
MSFWKSFLKQPQMTFSRDIFSLKNTKQDTQSGEGIYPRIVTRN